MTCVEETDMTTRRGVPQVPISVVMSVHNGERYLREAAASILDQSFTDFEFIIVDDGSTDGTGEILASLRDPRIVLVRQENTGTTKALNKGIALARGKYIARQDADDVSRPQRLAAQFAYMEANPEVALLGTRFEFIDQFGSVTRQGSLPLDDKTLQQRLRVINQFCHGSVLIRREALDRVGPYREFFRYAQDYDLWLRIAESYQIGNLPDYLFCYRELPQAISADKILSQSLYAGIAADLARQRREGGTDTLEAGGIPQPPPVQALSRELQQKLTAFYTENPGELVKGLRSEENCHQITFLLEQICAEKRQCQSELAARSRMIDEVEGRTRRLLTETAAALAGHREQEIGQLKRQLHELELERKDAQLHLEQSLSRVDEAQARLELALREKGELVRALEQQAAQHLAEAASSDRRFRELELKLKDTHLRLEQSLSRVDEAQARLDQALREKVEFVKALEEKAARHVAEAASSDRRIRELEAEAAANLRETGDLRDELAVSRGRLAEMADELARARQLQAAIDEKERTIQSLLSSRSWQITAPLRAVGARFKK